MCTLEKLAIKWCLDELTDNEIFFLQKLLEDEKNFIQFVSYIESHAVVGPQKK